MEEHGKFDVSQFADELARAPENHEVGTAVRFENDPDDPMIHDLENVGSTTMRFITVELKH